MKDPRSNSIEGFIAALEIFALYLEDGLKQQFAFEAEHDCIYISVESDEVSPEDVEKLSALGWHESSETGTWAYFT